MSATPTPGPWRWELNEKSKRVVLCGGNPHYDLDVMGFQRWGMGSASPHFREDVDRMCIMHRATKWAHPVKGREHHSSWFMGINHPDANLIAAAPGLLDALELILATTSRELFEVDALQKAKAAIAKAKGEMK